MMVYTRLEGRALAEIVEPEGFKARLEGGCGPDPACRVASRILRPEEALTVSLADTHDLPPPQFAFVEGGRATLQRLGEATRLVMLGVSAEGGPPFEGLLTALLVARRVARESDGLVFDPDSLKLWHPDELPVPEPDRQVAIEEYLSLGVLPLENRYRIVTFGLKKFGRPDLVLEDVEEAALADATRLVRLGAVRFVRGDSLETIEVEAGDVGEAASDAVLKLGPAQRRDSDPDNELRQITLPEGQNASRVLAGR